MTQNHKAKSEARARAAQTGESYATARRATAGKTAETVAAAPVARPVEAEAGTPADHPLFAVGDRARLLHGSPNDARRWWTVEAVDTRFVVLTRQADFRPKGEHSYTIIDWVRDLRGPSNQLGQGWSVDEPGGSDSLLRALNAYLEMIAELKRLGPGASVRPAEITAEVSYRNNVPIGFAALELRGPHTTQTSAPAGAECRA